MNCETCKHAGYERDGSATILQCRHPVVLGNLCCESCHEWQPMDAFPLVTGGGPVRLRCRKCHHEQNMPRMNDWRCGYPAESPPAWCPGYESSEPEPEPEPKSPQMSLFD